MAKLEAVISADISGFQAALSKATAGAEEFSGKLAGVGNKLLASISGIDISKAMGIGVAIYAAQKLGDTLVSAARKGLESFEAYERAVLRFKYTLPTGPGGTAAAGARAEEIATMAGAKSGLYSAEQMRTAALYLAEASRELRESPEKLNDMLDTLKAFALKTGTAPEEIAEAYRRLVVGIKEEGGMAVGKFFKSTPGMEAEVEKLRDAHAEAYLHAQGLGDASQASAAQAAEYHRLQTQSVSDFMSEETSRKGASAVLEEIKGILERSAPKAIIGEAEAASPGAMLAKVWGGVEKAFGEKLKPAVDDFARMMISVMPLIKDNLTNFGEALGQVLMGLVPIIVEVTNRLGDFMNALGVNKVLDDAKAISEHVDQVIAQKKAEKGIFDENSAAAKSAKAALAAPTGVFAAAAAEPGAGAFPTKESIKSAEEVAKTAARADAAHQESQRRINAEAEISDVKAAARAAARKALIDRPIGGTAALDKQYAAEAEAASKIINIKAEASAKEIAAEEVAAERIARIDEEQALRNIDRLAANAMDEGEQKNAALARLNALDAAAQLARDDAHAEVAEKIREADIDAANQIIDAQEEAAIKRIDAEKDAALKTFEETHPPPEEEEAPAGWETFSKYKRGQIEEGSADRKAREERNRDAKANYKREHEIARIGIEREYDERKRQAEDALELQRPTQISLKRVHEVQQEEHVKAIEAEKGRTEADQSYAEQHKELGLAEPKKPPTGRADISRKILADILTKIFEGQQTQIKEFEEVFMQA